jgi:hypothetical protein
METHDSPDTYDGGLRRGQTAVRMLNFSTVVWLGSRKAS